MVHYLREYAQLKGDKRLQHLLPKGVCPFLFYNLTPYIYTLSRGGWFNWVIRRKDRSFRKTIHEIDFYKHEVNRLYPNEVLVRCPNPHINLVVGVGPWGSHEIKLRVLYTDKACHARHRSGDEFIVDQTEFEEKSLAYSRMFPEVLSLYTIEQPLSGNGTCRRQSDRVSVEVNRMMFPCRYHTRKKLFSGNLLPDHFCLHVFAQIYPVVLCLMYDAAIKGPIEVAHPASRGSVALDITKRKRNIHFPIGIIRRVKGVLAKLYSVIFHPVDLTDYDIEIKILKSDVSDCMLREGKAYMVNMRSEDYLCPATFHALYPYVILADAGHVFRWNGTEDRNRVPCPDCVGSVYTIRRAG